MIKTIFFDVGGVLLTNGWDRHSRARAAEKFGIDAEEHSKLHYEVADSFETGGLSLDGYLDHTVFWTKRTFSRDEFVAFMREQSQPIPGSLELLAELATHGGPTLATLNNESREINEHRIEAFGLRGYFSVFLSSCYLGVKKPDDAIYRTAVDIMQHRVDESIFIDDRPLNLECSELLGISSILFESPQQLREELAVRELL